jgi:iron complex outermembrane receptor protein
MVYNQKIKGENVQRFLAFLLFIHTVAIADITNLMGAYTYESELSHVTKDEAAGHVIVYDRQMLDQMQAHTLKDILKSLRGFSMQETNIGFLNFSLAGTSCSDSICVRLYVDDHEMSSAFFGSAFIWFANYDLAHIDHIETYIGGNALALGNEAGFVVIKLYTKKADRENGTVVQTGVDSLGSKSVQFLMSQIKDDYSYLVYGSGLDFEREQNHKGAYAFSNRFNHYNLFAKVDKKDDFHLQIARYSINRDDFMGPGKQQAPRENDSTTWYEYLEFKKDWHGLAITASYAKESFDLLIDDANGIKLHDTTMINRADRDFEADVFKVLVQKEVEVADHTLVMGAQYSRKTMRVNKNMFDGVDSPTGVGPTKLYITSLFIEDSWKLFDDLVLMGTMKYDGFATDYGRHYSDVIGRVGLI